MGKIKVLSSEVAQKIAAGEVVERPVSVVKELVENSLDAGANDIRVEVIEGGKKLIKVEDNGCGLSEEDIALCFERHATSKLSQVEDLEKIATLGFRGEALASIDSVSRLILKTSAGAGGFKVEREGGKLLRISEGAYPRGTSVEVRDLFFNLPVRQKFLRSAQSELTLIARYLTTVALAFPEISFSLYHGQRRLLHCPAVSTRRERFYQLFGRQALERLVDLAWQEGDYQVSGFVSRPPLGHPDRQRQFFYVNRRPVKDRTLAAAVQQAVKGRLEKDTFPEVYLFLTLPYEEVDVNVHPTKAEVKFRDSLRVFQIILSSLKEAMEKEAGAKPVYLGVAEAGPGGEEGEERASSRARGGEERLIPLFWKRVCEEAEERQSLISLSREKEPFDEKEIEELREEKSFQILGQYLNLYLIVADKDGLLIIDQHNAHERVLYEKYLEIDQRQAWASRQALFPLILELSPAEIMALEELKPDVEAMGFEIESLGGRSLLVRCFPDFLEAEEARRVLLGFIEAQAVAEAKPTRHELLATMACRTAIKAGVALSREKIEALVDAFFQAENPWLCPHGRPTVVRLNRSEIEKELKRPSN